MKKALYVLIGLSLAISSCDKEGTPLESPKTANNPESITVTTNLDNNLLLKLVNDRRVAGCNCGITAMPPVPAIIWNNLLAAAASVHSKDMSTNNFFAHQSSNGNTTANRVDATGYKWITIAENIANGHTNEQAVVDAWVASEGHCKNIMSASIKEMGAAKEGRYWTQVFATPR